MTAIVIGVAAYAICGALHQAAGRIADAILKSSNSGAPKQ